MKKNPFNTSILWKKNKNNIVVDIETLATTANAVIVSIGAVKLKKSDAVKIGDNPFEDFFYKKIKLQSCIDLGMDIEAGTLAWWMKQPDEARDMFKHTGISLKRALLKLTEWVGEDARIWGNGSDFDNAILKNAYSACAINCPWHYRNSRCYRTLAAGHPHIKYKHEGIKHHALHDAKSEARHLFKILNS